MKKNILIIHYNTPYLTECLVRSINLFVKDAIIYIFDNSNEKPFMMQSYAYPAADYRTNEMIGAPNPRVYIGDNMADGIKGVPVGHEDY